ncbi:hypothetical protein MBANPS3_004082 [Mucor bainieri]
MTDIIAYLEDQYTAFSALKLCKKFSIINKAEAVWARSYNKASIDLASSERTWLYYGEKY